MSLVTFPLFILTLSLLHLAQATTCQGYNCPTGDYYLELNIASGANNQSQRSEKEMACDVLSVEMFSFHFSISGLIITGGLQLRGWGHATSIETFPTGNCSIPPFPKPGDLQSFQTYLPRSVVWSVGHTYRFSLCRRLWTVTEYPQIRVTFQTSDHSDPITVIEVKKMVRVRGLLRQKRATGLEHGHKNTKPEGSMFSNLLHNSLSASGWD